MPFVRDDAEERKTRIDEMLERVSREAGAESVEEQRDRDRLRALLTREQAERERLTHRNSSA